MLTGSAVQFEATVGSASEFCKKIREESWLTNVRFDSIHVTATGDEVLCSFGVADAF